ncbi:F-box/FBD/LRR-repeat protein At1g51370-like [Vicia villosa]|uniref:F-box/FBD/LRR-repeat protein At1g51370-like n=1 Tax=Vicia villosa TaxID=3911 RepID=UPI00273CC660|nr:F-box/FBD/LRR-repeat protein At1g51370-like [Vicia villosa]XP_058760940.1 F-box/FBD/LRR-repeat protein At1g51370-like [Vicia villosa]
MQRCRISEEDKISRLPDEILSHILSFLTTKKAVRTSLLSKRWTDLWQSCDTIDFTDILVHCNRTNRRCNKLVESVLATTDSRSINTFLLEILYGHPHFAYKVSFRNVVKWVNKIVLQHQLKNLCLHLDVDEYDDEDNNEDEHFLPKLPNCIFTCKTLVSLDLRRFRVQGFNFSSDGFGFPLLKTLHLDDVEFPKGRDFLLLLSGCPILEDLKLFHVYLECWFNESVILKEFESLSLPKLTRTDIIESLCRILPLKALATSKYLCLDRLQFHEPFKVNQAFDGIPIFPNLTHLKLTESWDLVVQVLHHCPKLQNIELYEAMYVARENEDNDLVPQCLLSHLRNCIIHDLGRLHRKFILPMYILKNARILQTMKIKIWYRSELSEIERKLSLCPKASATCQLFVHV